MNLVNTYGPVANSEWDIVKAPAPWGIFKAYLLVADAVTVKVPDTSIVPVLYNPPTSGVVFQILRVHWGVTGGTIAASAEEYALANGVTHSSTTDGPAPINMSYGHGTNFLGNWYKVTTMSAASTTILPYGTNAGGANGAGARSVERFDEGRIYLYPGGTFIPVTASGALAATVIPMVEFLQMPLSAVTPALPQ